MSNQYNGSSYNLSAYRVRKYAHILSFHPQQTFSRDIILHFTNDETSSGELGDFLRAGTEVSRDARLSVLGVPGGRGWLGACLGLR